ncbi:amino acid ABC transporter ATP-binding protein [Clostridium intestinale]|jgi:polar amino acid transport system ATP-binding protein|uniref:Glutamine transport ATP-binding protein GlnQ n=2 Tax=Clostridium intestinale TaxID=36845 RepID=U2NHP4_9CLOT|nr:amino acid ABC transporter ATP-binding protein [Clostridium intestinale]ERK28391.1 Glutamine transport ATP-binding protein GlnQ [Clostridium intestinale URNW]QLY79745.1 amino acid ABC transporter ATP-binding protein [Clostridium intestinale]
MTLKVSELNKSFKGKQVLKNVSFQVEEGEIVALLGQSGAGKTTVLRCINGLEKADGGSIEISDIPLFEEKNGKVVYCSKETMKEVRKNLGMVFQSYNLFPHMSVLENIIEAPVNVFKISKDEAKRDANELLKQIGLEDKENAYPFELSGGQKQRVAIARACALNPKIMCFDEPTSALDPELTEGIATVIDGLSKKGMGILIITHDMAFAKRVAHKVLFMADGEIIEEGSVEEIFNNPKKEKTKNFVK